MKLFLTLAILTSITYTLTGCLLDSEPKTIQRTTDVGPECLREDSTTWTDTSETKHMGCTLDPKPSHP